MDAVRALTDVETSSLLTSVAAGLLTLSLAGSASAQTASAPRGDAVGIAAWQLADTGDTGPYANTRWDGAFFGGAGAGVYWTEHHKTELDFGASTSTSGFHARQIVVDGHPALESWTLRFSRRTLGISQHYQFFRNAWFHPHVAAGVNVTWERRVEDYQPLTIYEPNRPPRFVRGPRSEGPRTETTLRPFVATGFKAYVSERAFFRTDMRIAFRGAPDESHVRVGFGVDF